MPSRKQRRRREKERRHEYVYVDDEGNEIDPAELAPRRAEKLAAKPQTRSGRPAKKIEPPSWRRVFRRAALFAPFMFAVIWLTSKNVPVTGRLLVAGGYTMLFVPFFYLVDSLAYRTYLKRTGQAPPRSGKDR